MSAAALVLSIAACVDGSTLIVTEQDADREIRLAARDQLHIRLKAQPGTGYSWEVSAVNPAVLQGGSVTVEPPPAPRPGGVTIQVFRFEAVASGETRLTLKYVRPWEHGSVPARTFHLRVHVR